MSDQNWLPNHIAIIMDGNGRWALKRNLPRQIGHEQGAKAAENVIRYAGELGVRYVTLYAFSSENWQRPSEEVNSVMQILERYLKKDSDDLVNNGIKICTIGDTERLPHHLRSAIKGVVEKTMHGQKLVITLAISYSSWEEIVYACKNILSGHINIDQVTEKRIKEHLYTNDLPDPDLLIRTGGEVRLSNFLLLQLSYSELYFCKTLWPDFQRADLDRALKSFRSRNRRFGNVSAG